MVNGKTSISGTYTQNLTNTENCDSTLTIVATVTHSSEETIEVTNCDSVVVNGKAYFTSGTYTQNLTNTENCDSTLTIVATVTHSSEETIQVANCDSVVVNGKLTLPVELILRI